MACYSSGPPQDFLKMGVGVSITTYLLTGDGLQQPILTHTFWGATLNEATQRLAEHLQHDSFFLDSFKGHMGMDILSNQSEVIYRYPPKRVTGDLDFYLSEIYRVVGNL